MRWQGLQVEAEGTGISAPLSRQVNLLGSLLGEAIRAEGGDEMLELVERLRKLCKQAFTDDDAASRDEAARLIGDLDHDALVWLLRAFTAFFHLVNQAEKQEIIRINRARARASASDGTPRAESIDEAIYELKRRGLSLDQVVDLLGRLDIQPTLTAHPTEARRRSVLYKQQRIATLLGRLQRCEQTPEEEEQILSEIYAQIAILLATDEIRVERPTVLDEVEQGLYFLQTTIWETVPRIHRDVRRALVRHYGQAPDVPIFLRYRSWIGSDRDGNPNVTPEVTRRTATRQRQVALGRYLDELLELRRELSLSDQLVPVPDRLYASIEADAEEVPFDASRKRQYAHEPYRLKVSYMGVRIEHMLAELSGDAEPRPEPWYTAARFMSDLRLLQSCLADSGFAELAYEGRLERLLVLAQTFGFHMSALDVRQHSRVHEQAAAALLRLAGVEADYAGLDEAARLRLLTSELSHPRPLLPRGAALPEEATLALDALHVLRELIAESDDEAGIYIVSMTHGVSDLLEVLLLAKEVGLWHLDGDAVRCPLDVVPLFETIDDLAEAEALLRALYETPIYRQHLAGRGDFQEIMLGYSDSNKDGGYWMANWALHKAQERIGRVCAEYGLSFRLFHGRGGTVGRGGGRANQAILALPSIVHTGRIRFTEQGEVISFRYSLPEIAQRHLEQIVSAMIEASAPPYGGDGQALAADGPEAGLMDQIAERAMETYRGLIDADGLWRWYTQVTPIEQISRLPIASRPVSRKGAGEVDFDGLRAIPWGFAWTQVRYLVPGWYGTGTALDDALQEQSDAADLLRRLYATWPFFRAVARNASREMARARFEVASYYADLAPSGAPFHRQIQADFERAQEALGTLIGDEADPAVHPVIRKSIRLRNPYTDVLNLVQVELLRRYRAAEGDGEQDRLRQALFLSINGIAAAMQSTG